MYKSIYIVRKHQYEIEVHWYKMFDYRGYYCECGYIEHFSKDYLVFDDYGSAYASLMSRMMKELRMLGNMPPKQIDSYATFLIKKIQYLSTQKL